MFLYDEDRRGLFWNSAPFLRKRFRLIRGDPELSMGGGEDFVAFAQAAREVAGDIQQKNSVLIGHVLVKLVEINSGQSREGAVRNRFHIGDARESFENAHLSEKIATP